MLAADAPGLHVYYVDDHFVPYEGAKPVPKGWNTKRRHAQPGRADTMVTDYHGRAVCFATGDPSGLAATLPGALAQLRQVLGPSGEDPARLRPRRLLPAGRSAPSATQRADWVTWRRAPLAPVTAAPRRYWAARGDGKPAEVLHPRRRDRARSRTTARPGRSPCSRTAAPVLQVLTSDIDAPAAALLSWLRCRWRIENLFKYLEDNYGIHWLCDYHASTRRRRPPDRQPRAQGRAAPGCARPRQPSPPPSETSPPCSPARSSPPPRRTRPSRAAEKKITRASDAVTAAKAALKAIPAKLPASQVTPGAQKAILRTRRRSLQMVLRLLAAVSRALARQPAQRLPARPRRVPGHHPPPAPPRRHHHLHAPRDHRDPRPARPRPGSPAPSPCSSTRSTQPRPACPATPGPSPTSSRRTPGFNNDQGPTSGGLSLSPAKTGRYQDPAMTIDDLARQGSSKP